jgi:flagellar hook assembly protein FlgD
LLQASDGSIYAGTSPNGDIFRYNPPTSVEENHPATVHQYQLAQNYPNPFNSTTVIRFQMAKAGRVAIKVYNVLGQKVRIVEDGYYEAGWHEIQFDGLDQNNQLIAYGTYLYSMEAAKYTSVKKFLFLR